MFNVFAVGLRGGWYAGTAPREQRDQARGLHGGNFRRSSQEEGYPAILRLEKEPRAPKKMEVHCK